MKRTAIVVALLPCLLISAPLAAEPGGELAKEGKVLMKQFAGELKTSLKSAIKQGGLVNGIEACQLKAPEIASANSQGQWQISRTSLKPRNPDNQPSAKQALILKDFEQQLAEGKPASELVYMSKADDSFHMMKAIPTQGFCLSCHGQSLNEGVKKTLAEKYPNDKAVGYQEGQIRGAFNLVYSYK